MCILLFTKVLNYEVKTIPVNQKFKLQPASNYFLLSVKADIAYIRHTALEGRIVLNRGSSKATLVEH